MIEEVEEIFLDNKEVISLSPRHPALPLLNSEALTATDNQDLEK
jgi:hypothetical protein